MPKIVDNYLDISDCNISQDKVYTTKFGGLLGVDSFNKKGDTLLQIWKIIKGDPFNKFYTIRGEKAELIVKRYFEEMGIEYKWYGADTKVYDMFNNSFFGGNLDFSINICDEWRSVEVKSKNIKDMEFIKKNGIQATHLAQTKLGLYLSGYNYGNVIYVFFTDEQEAKIQNELDKKDYFDINKDWTNEMYLTQFEQIDVPFNEKQVREEMTYVYKYYMWCLQNKKIPLKDISDKSLTKLGLTRPLEHSGIFNRGINI